MKAMLKLAVQTLSILMVFALNVHAESTSQLIKQLQVLQSNDQSNQTATHVLKQLNSASDVTIIQSLTAMKGSTPVGRNWLLGLANALYRKSGKSQTKVLNSFLMDPSQDGEARYAVFQWLTVNDANLRSKLLSEMREDTSPELRYLAISEAIESEPAITELQSLLEAARHPQQVITIIGKLKEQGATIDQSKQFGFITEWRLIGPFDNVGTVNFEKSFAVESDWVNGSVKEEYEGKKEVDGKKINVKWIAETTKNEEGIVELATIFANEKGCVVYAEAEFNSEKDQDADLRLGCINGNKTWLNGKQIMSNEVYHTNMQIDQYNQPVRLKAGTNRVLVKIVQNEQTEQWAQRFAFQLRVSDSTGKAILSKGK